MEPEALERRWLQAIREPEALEQHRWPLANLESEVLERRWPQAILERIKEIFDILCMPVKPLHLINALALMRCSLERLLELEDTEQCLEQEDSGLDLAIRELEDAEVRLEPEDSGLEPEGSGQHAMGAPPH